MQIFLWACLKRDTYDNIGDIIIHPMFAELSICDISDEFIAMAYCLRDCLGFGELKGINLTDTSRRGDLISLDCRDNDIFCPKSNRKMYCAIHQFTKNKYGGGSWKEETLEHQKVNSRPYYILPL